jgi:hypothetical protein
MVDTNKLRQSFCIELKNGVFDILLSEPSMAKRALVNNSEENHKHSACTNDVRDPRSTPNVINQLSLFEINFIRVHK